MESIIPMYHVFPMSSGCVQMTGLSPFVIENREGDVEYISNFHNIVFQPFELSVFYEGVFFVKLGKAIPYIAGNPDLNAIYYIAEYRFIEW